MVLVLRVVNLSKGSITVESTLGKGTKMMVELPRGEATKKEAKSLAPFH